MKRFFSIIAMFVLFGCIDPLRDVPVGSGEVYFVNQAFAFQAGFSGSGGVPRLCPVLAGGQVPSCLRTTTLPVKGQTVSRQTKVGRIGYEIHRTTLPAAGRYAFFRAQDTSRNSFSRSTATFFVEDSTMVFDVRPNTVLIMPQQRPDLDALDAAVAADQAGSTEVSVPFKAVPDAELIAIARSAMRAIYGAEADRLSYRVGRVWEVSDASRAGFRLVRQVGP